MFPKGLDSYKIEVKYIQDSISLSYNFVVLTSMTPILTRII